MARPRLAPAGHGTIGFTELPDGVRAHAYVRESGQERRRLTASGPTEEAARKALEARLAMRAAGHTAKITADTTLEALGAAYKATLDGVGSTTAKAYARAVDRHIVPALGATALSCVNLEAVEDFLADLGEQKPAAAKIARIALRGMLAMAVEAGVLEDVPVGKDPLPQSRSRQEPDRLMTRVDLERMRRRIRAWQDEPTVGKPRSRQLEGQAMLFVVPGIRSAAEALEASWEHIDLVTGIMRIPGKRTRTVRLYPAAVEMLQERWEAAGNPSEGLVFPSSAGRPVAGPNFRRGLALAAGEDFAWVTAGCMISH